MLLQLLVDFVREYKNFNESLFSSLKNKLGKKKPFCFSVLNCFNLEMKEKIVSLPKNFNSCFMCFIFLERDDSSAVKYFI